MQRKIEPLQQKASSKNLKNGCPAPLVPVPNSVDIANDPNAFQQFNLNNNFLTPQAYQP